MRSKSLCLGNSCMGDIEKYSNMVYKLAFSLVKNEYDADDVYQDVFLQYIQKMPHFQSEEHKKAWFLRVTINRCKNFFKTAWMLKVLKVQKDEDMDAAVGELSLHTVKGVERKESVSVPSAEDEYLRTQQDELINLVKTLPHKYRVVIHLFYYEDLSVEEISVILKKKPSTVRTQLTRARELLRKVMKEESYVS